MGGVQEPGILQIKELVYEQMGHLFFDQQLTEQAHESLKQARTIATQINDTVGMIRIYRDVGRIFIQKKNYILARHNLNVAMKLVQLAQDDGELFRSVATQEAALYLAEGENESAYGYLKFFLNNPSKSDDKEQLYLLAGDYYVHQERYDSAVYYFDSLLQMGSVYIQREASGRMLNVVAR